MPSFRSPRWLLSLLFICLFLGAPLSAQETQEGPPDTGPEAGLAGPALADDPSAEAESTESFSTAGSELPAEAATTEAAPESGAESAATEETTSASIQEQMAQKRAEAESTSIADRIMSLVGLFAMVGIAWLMSNNRSRIDYRMVGMGIGLQLIFGVLVLKTDAGRWLFARLNEIVVALLGFTTQGAQFIFGNLVYSNVPVGHVPVDAFGPMTSIASDPTIWANTGGFFAFNVLPTIIFFSALMTLLYHMGVMQFFVNIMASFMQKTMRTSGSETLSAAANIFVGQTEAPLVVKPYVATMTNSELMAIMTGGFATVAGGVMAAYVGMLQNYFPDIAGHLIAASVMSAPAALVIAKVMFPETQQSMTSGAVKMSVEKPDVNAIDAAARGAGEGLQLALNVGAMLLAFIALVAMLNWILGGIGSLVGWESLSFELILSYVFFPIAWLMGIPWAECATAATLLGEKMVLNEFWAYTHLANMLGSGTELSYRSIVILTYALCGFANFGSIAIQIGGIGGIAPGRRHDLARIGVKAMIGGTIAAFMTATVAGLLL